MNIKMIEAFGIALVITLIAYPLVIPFLHRVKFGQTVRADGPQSHLAKSGTPTMGGTVFIIASILTTIIVEPQALTDLNLLVVMLAFVGYGAIGFIDDFIIVVKKDNEGLKPKAKFLLQSLLAIAFYLLYRNVNDTQIIIPFVHKYLDLGHFYIIVVFFMFTGASNAVNLTDGLDGLCSGLSILAIIPFIYFCVRSNMMDVAIFLCAVEGSLLGYLRYNWHPAKIFMGDTGSLALGGLLAAVAMVTKEEIALVFVGGVFVIETLSCILQVGYFKATHGKRLFRMAPIHHHFELGGMSEVHVVLMFWAVGLLLCILGIAMGMAL